MIWLSHWKIGNQLEGGDEVDVTVILWASMKLKEFGIQVVYEQEENNTQQGDLYPSFHNVVNEDLSAYQVSTGMYFLCHHDFDIYQDCSKSGGWTSKGWNGDYGVFHANRIAMSQLLATTKEVKSWHSFIYPSLLRPRKRMETSRALLPHNTTKSLIWSHSPNVFGIPEADEDMMMLSYWKFENQLEGGDELHISVVGRIAKQLVKKYPNYNSLSMEMSFLEMHLPYIRQAKKSSVSAIICFKALQFETRSLRQAYTCLLAGYLPTELGLLPGLHPLRCLHLLSDHTLHPRHHPRSFPFRSVLGEIPPTSGLGEVVNLFVKYLTLSSVPFTEVSDLVAYSESPRWRVSGSSDGFKSRNAMTVTYVDSIGCWNTRIQRPLYWFLFYWLLEHTY
ncbi:hypothetical protein TEA_009225 [Camellia sinensis var. sinensis]|uniref:Uncharacterized protein n=1 Tax=Camellia sinensis var. sinensis TaxID=542762 RepID=A0A4S4EEA3_CAMSN|nr:hypothetical protein TEA_009225 [Camellia sinensis var. sinensis]